MRPSMGGRTRPRPKNLGMPQRGGDPMRGDPMNGIGKPFPGMGGGMGRKPGAGGGFDYDAFNAWQDPNISDGGASAGPIQQGWGGFDSLHDGVGAHSMLATKMNDYLNQQATGGPREHMMNQLGYFNGGNPFKPSSVRGTGINRAYRDQAGQMDLGNSVPGTYQAMALNPAGVGGYIGMTNVDQSGSAQYTPFGRQRTRRTRTFGEVMQ